MARMIDIGFRLLPHPPIPIVIPSLSWATTSSSVNLLSFIASCRSLVELRIPLGDKGVACFVTHSRQVQLEREPPLEPVGPLHVDRVDAVQRLLRRPDHHGALLGDVAGQR